MKVTVYDVAREAGLSIATVSRYINKKGGISERSETKIINAIEKLHYVPDKAAQNLAKGMSGTIGFHVGYYDLESHYIHQFMAGAFKAVREEEFDILLTQIEGDVFSACNKILTGKKMDGLIFAAPTDETEYIKYLYEKEYPVVYTGMRMEWDKRDSNVYGGFSVYRKEILQLFLRKGCRRILCIEMDKDTAIRMKKLINQSSEPEKFMEPIYFTKHSGKKLYEYVLKILNSEERLDAIFFTEHEYAGYIYAAANVAGISIPSELKLVSIIHSEQQEKLFVPNLAVVYINAFQMGYQAGKKACQLIKKEEIDYALDIVPYEIRENETIG